MVGQISSSVMESQPVGSQIDVVYLEGVALYTMASATKVSSLVQGCSCIVLHGHSLAARATNSPSISHSRVVAHRGTVGDGYAGACNQEDNIHHTDIAHMLLAQS